MDIISYILSRKYTDMSIVGLGSIKGANCTVKDIVHQDGINTVTFEWEGTDGTKKTRDMVVYDGTPIYVWESGNTYHYGDLAIYESQFYRCIVENSDATFDDTKWNEIGSPDGNYDIVQSKALLPARFTAADRKLYFVIDECIFYLWDGYQWVALNHVVQVDSFPVASAKYFGKIYQYIGATTNDYTHGYFYQCVSNSETPAVYSWEYVQTSDIQIATVQKAGIVKPDDETIRVDANGTISVIDRLFVGTQDEWDALTPIQQALYKPIHITDDEEVLDLGVYLRKVKTMPNAEDAPSEFVMYIGATTADYTRGYIYRSVPSIVSGETVYNWVRQDTQPSHPYIQSDWAQNNSSANDYIKNKPTLGTASEKNFTDNVRPNSHDLVESNAVYNAISSSIASIYKPHGDLTCAQLTSDLLIPTNIGNVYNMTDSGTTSALFIQGAGKTIHVNDTVGIIQADNSEIMFNLMGSMLDLHDYQTKELETPLTIGGVQQTTVESALGALNSENIPHYDIMPSETELFAMPNNTTFRIDGFYDKNDGCGGYYRIQNNYQASALKVYNSEGTSYHCLIQLDNGIPNREYVNLCRFGIRPYTRTIDGNTVLTPENTYATLNSTIMSKLVNGVSSGYTLYLPCGRYYFENTLDLSVNQRSLKGEELPQNTYSSFTVDNWHTVGTMLCFPFLSDGQYGIKLGNGNIENVYVYGDIANYDITIDRTKVISAPNEVVTETIKTDYHCVGIYKQGGGILHNVSVCGFYSGIECAGNVYLFNIYARKCHFGLTIGNDVKCIGVYGWDVYALVKVNASISSINQLRVDSCVNAMYVTRAEGGTWTDIDGDWCTDSLIRIENDTVGQVVRNVIMEGIHGRCCVLNAYNSSNSSSPDVRTLADTNGYGVIRAVNTAFYDNYVVFNSQNRGTVTSTYETPRILFTFNDSNVTITRNHFISPNNDIAVKDDVLKCIQTKSGMTARYDTSKATYYLDNTNVTQELQGVEFTAQELQAMW